MTDYLFRLEVSADKSSFSVGEALEATSAAIHPDSAAEAPVMILSIDKVEHRLLLGDLEGPPASLTDDDWQVLRGIWAGMPTPEFPMPAEQWQTYLDAFNSSLHRPEGWSLSALQRDPNMQAHLARAFTRDDHRDLLKRAVTAGAVSLRNPMTGIQSELGWVGDAHSWLLTRRHMKTFCDLLAIELVEPPAPVPHFITSAWPLAVSPELLTLQAEARITYEDNFGRERGNGACLARDYRAKIEATIARQAEGYFTLNEAALVLADSRPDIDATEAVKRFLRAHAKGELQIHQRGSRFPLEFGETIRDFWDMVEATELDAWLRASAGYGFPPAEVAEPVPTAVPATPKRPRKTWRDVAWDYIVERMRDGMFSSAVQLNHTLHAEAGREGSPFDKGEGHNRGSLWVREIGQPLALKTIQNSWSELQAASRAR